MWLSNGRWYPDPFFVVNYSWRASDVTQHFKNIEELTYIKFDQNYRSLIKIIEKIIKIYNIKWVYSENKINEESNDT
jgi:hypothetical protein